MITLTLILKKTENEDKNNIAHVICTPKQKQLLIKLTLMIMHLIQSISQL